MGSKALTLTYVLDANSYFTFNFIGTKRSMSRGWLEEGWKTYLTIWLVKAEITGKGCRLAMPGLFFPSKALQKVKTNIS